jgi:Leucine-rich repeat (LRR) protein
MSTLDLQYNQLEDMIDLNDKSYQILVLNKNYLRYIPFECVPITVKHLSLDQNELKRLEIDVPLPNLETLTAEMNHIRYVDLSVFLSSLHTLNLKKNKIENLDFLVCMPSLKHLNLSFNSIQVLDKLPRTLETLNVSFANVQLIQSRLPQGLVEATFVGNSLKLGSIPLNWGSSLRKLNLCDNLLTEFPKRLPETLEELHLQNNQIVEVPSKLPENLKVLNLSLNKIRSIPSKMNVRLQILALSNNQLTQDFSREKVTWCSHCIVQSNWNETTHHTAQRVLRKCWKQYLLKIRCRHLYRARKIYDELMMVALHPDHILQTDVFSPEWSIRSV